jgi:acetyl esterase/lipase
MLTRGSSADIRGNKRWQWRAFVQEHGVRAGMSVFAANYQPAPAIGFDASEQQRLR